MYRNYTPIKRICALAIFLLFILHLNNSCYAQKVFDLARTGTAQQMTKHLKRHPDHVNLLSEQGASPFLLAAYNGNNEVAVILLNKGADLKQCYPEGSVLYALIYKNNLPLLDSILVKGVNVNDSCNFEQFGYPIHFALALQRYEIVERLFLQGLNLSVKDQQGRTLEQLIALYNDPKYYEIFKQYEK
jgi:ankyrin repeat protein